MSGGKICRCLTGTMKQRKEARLRCWEVMQRNSNHSTFNGGKYTSSAYSEVHCKPCGARWRTKADYVGLLPNAKQ